MGTGLAISYREIKYREIVPLLWILLAGHDEEALGKPHRCQAGGVDELGVG